MYWSAEFEVRSSPEDSKEFRSRELENIKSTNLNKAIRGMQCFRPVGFGQKKNPSNWTLWVDILGPNPAKEHLRFGRVLIWTSSYWSSWIAWLRILCYHCHKRWNSTTSMWFLAKSPSLFPPFFLFLSKNKKNNVSPLCSNGKDITTIAIVSLSHQQALRCHHHGCQNSILNCRIYDSTIPRSRSASGRGAECVFLPGYHECASVWWPWRRWSTWPRWHWRELDRVTNYCSLLYYVFPFHPPRQVFFFSYSLFEVLFHC